MNPYADNPFRPATEEERYAWQGGKLNEVYATGNELKAILGHTLPGGPDGKTDVEFCSMTNQGELISLWNWKDGGYELADDEELDLEEFMAEGRNWSVYYTNPEALQQLRYWLAVHRKS